MAAALPSPVVPLRECVLHKRHEPRALTIEEHHVIPRAWQQVYVPPVAPFPTRWQGQVLWDGRTVPLAPTCHRNVHACIVELMRELAALPALPSLAAWAATVEIARRRVGGQLTTMEYAAYAPARFIAAGGDLHALFAARQWGEA